MRLSELDHLRLGPGAAALDDVFLHRTDRTVRRDATVRWQGGLWEVLGLRPRPQQRQPTA